MQWKLLLIIDYTKSDSSILEQARLHHTTQLNYRAVVLSTDFQFIGIGIGINGNTIGYWDVGVGLKVL